MKKFYLALFVGIFLPSVASASASFTTIITSVGEWIGSLTPIVLALALLYFFWGLANFILKSGEEKEKGRDIMIYGIIALFVMVSVWGLVSVVQNSFDIDGSGVNTPPHIPGVDI